jgi:hypothetical protein
MTGRTWSGALALLSALSVSAAAQGGGKPTTGNPTPGVAQPEPPNLADRVTVTGCVQLAPQAPNATASDAPADARFVLAGAERQGTVPADTGGSTLATETSSRTFRLAAIESQLSPFVGTKVEISGEIKPRPAGAAPNVTPILQVEFVQKLATNCP